MNSEDKKPVIYEPPPVSASERFLFRGQILNFSLKVLIKIGSFNGGFYCVTKKCALGDHNVLHVLPDTYS